MSKKINLIVSCKNCKKLFKTIPSWVKAGGGKYCSVSCYRQSRKGRSTATLKTRLLMSKAHKGKTLSKTTRLKCSIARKGSKNHNWKGWKYQNGYIQLYMPNHPYNNANYILMHRFICEQILGRYLNPKEIVHHINEIHYDNRPENLYVFSNHGQHLKHHILSKKNKSLKTIKSNLPIFSLPS